MVLGRQQAPRQRPVRFPQQAAPAPTVSLPQFKPLSAAPKEQSLASIIRAIQQASRIQQATQMQEEAEKKRIETRAAEPGTPQYQQLEQEMTEGLDMKEPTPGVVADIFRKIKISDPWSFQRAGLEVIDRIFPGDIPDDPHLSFNHPVTKRPVNIPLFPTPMQAANKFLLEGGVEQLGIYKDTVGLEKKAQRQEAKDAVIPSAQRAWEPGEEQAVVGSFLAHKLGITEDPLTPFQKEAKEFAEHIKGLPNEEANKLIDRRNLLDLEGVLPFTPGAQDLAWAARGSAVAGIPGAVALGTAGYLTRQAGRLVRPLSKIFPTFRTADQYVDDAIRKADEGIDPKTASETKIDGATVDAPSMETRKTVDLLSREFRIREEEQIQRAQRIRTNEELDPIVKAARDHMDEQRETAGVKNLFRPLDEVITEEFPKLPKEGEILERMMHENRGSSIPTWVRSNTLAKKVYLWTDPQRNVGDEFVDFTKKSLDDMDWHEVERGIKGIFLENEGLRATGTRLAEVQKVLWRRLFVEMDVPIVKEGDQGLVEVVASGRMNPLDRLRPGDAQRITLSDLMEHPWKWLRPNGEDWGDTFYQNRAIVNRALDDWYAHMAEEGLKIPKVDLKGMDHARYGNRGSHYFPRGAAHLEDEVKGAAEKTIRERANFDNERVMGSGTEGYELGWRYGDDLAELMFDYERGTYHAIANHRFLKQIQNVGTKWQSLLDDHILERGKALEKRDTLRKDFTRIKKSIISGKKMKPVAKTKTYNTVKTVREAGFKNISEARTVAKTPLNKRTASMKKKWDALASAKLKVFLAESQTLKGVPRSFTDMNLSQPEALEKLKDILSVSEREAILSAQDIRDPKVRASVLQRIEDSMNARVREEIVELNDIRKKIEDAKYKGKDPKQAHEIRITLKKAAPVKELEDYIFTGENGKKAKEYLEKKFEKSGTEWLKTVRVANDIHRLAVLGGDNAAPFNQGSYFWANNFGKWADTTGKSIEAMIKPEVFEEFVVQELDFWRWYVNGGGTFGNSEWFAAIGRTGVLAALESHETMRNFLRNVREIPDVRMNMAKESGPAAKRFINAAQKTSKLGIGKTIAGVPFSAVKLLYSRSMSAYDMFLTYGRYQKMKSVLPLYRAEGRQDFEAIKFVDQFFGVSETIGMSNTLRSAESAVFLARNFYRSFLAIYLSALKGDLNGQQARESIMRLQMAKLLTHAYLARATQQELHLDPEDPYYQMVKIGDQWIGTPGSFDRAMIRLSSQITQEVGEAVNPDRYISRDQPDKGVWENEFLRIARGRFSGVGKLVSTIMDDQQDYMGNDIEGIQGWGKYISRDLGTMLWVQDVLFSTPEIRPQAGPPGFIGLPAFPESAQEKMQNLQDKLALEMTNGKKAYNYRTAYRMGIPQLGYAEKMELEKNHPEIRDAKSYWLQDAGLDGKYRGFSEDMTSYLIKDDEIRKKLYKNLEQLYPEADRELRPDNQFNTAETERVISGAFGEYRKRREENLNDYPEVKKFFDAKDPLDQPLMGTPPMDIARSDYYRSVAFNPAAYDETVIAEDGTVLNEGTTFNYEKWRELVQDYMTRWNNLAQGDENNNKGELILNTVRAQMHMDHELPPILREYHHFRMSLQNYYDMGMRLAENQGLLDEWKEETATGYPGYVSPEINAIKQAQTLARKQWRQKDQYLDLALFRFDKTDTFEHPLNKRDFDTEEGRSAVRSLSFSLESYQK